MCELTYDEDATQELREFVVDHAGNNNSWKHNSHRLFAHTCNCENDGPVLFVDNFVCDYIGFIITVIEGHDSESVNAYIVRHFEHGKCDDGLFWLDGKIVLFDDYVNRLFDDHQVVEKVAFKMEHA